VTVAAPMRLAPLDAARGLAVVAMVAYHLVWDLGNFGYIDPDIPYSRGEKLLGHVIAVSFLFIVGVSLVLAQSRNAGWAPFWRRLARVGAAAGLVTLGTYVAFPQAYVFFGILHCIALASLLAAPLLFAPWPAALLAALGAALAPTFLASPVFDASWLSWIGLSTFEPLTNDYQPILPWSAAVFAGVGAAKLLGPGAGAPLDPPARESRDRAGAPSRFHGEAALAWLGRHSLALYLLHQPALFGAFAALAYFGATPSPPAGGFVDACAQSCEASGGERSVCRDACACAAERAGEEGAPTEAKARASRLEEIARDCLVEGRGAP